MKLIDKSGRRKYLNEKERELYYKATLDAQLELKLFSLILFYSGARITEVLNLTKQNIDFFDKCVIFESLKKRKKGIFRQIPLRNDFLRLLFPLSPI